MAVTIKLKNASGSDPSASDLVVGEVALRTDLGKLFTKKDDNSIVEIGGSPTVADSSITSAKIVDGAIVNADINASAAIAGSKISPDFGSQNIVTTGTLGSGNVTISNSQPQLNFTDTNNNPDYAIFNENGVLKFKDTTNNQAILRLNAQHADFITNVDFFAGIDVTGAITGTDDLTLTGSNKKFISTSSSSGDYIRLYAASGTGKWDIYGNGADLRFSDNDSAGSIVFDRNVDANGGIDVTGAITSTGDITITNAIPRINFVDSGEDPDWEIGNINGAFRFRDTTNAATYMQINTDGHVDINGNLDVGAGIDVTGNISVSGTVDGVDIAARNTLFGGLTSSSGVLTNGVTGTTQGASDNTTKVATTAYVTTAISNLINGAPSALDTLNELAAAMNDDAAFSTTVTNSLATKMPLAGGQFTGNITFSGSQTVDGRDLSVDGSKLDGIESGATADQSNSEIKTAYEANSNTNAFTDALLSKLNGIAASATNVTNTNQLTNGAGFITATLTEEQVEDFVGGMLTGNTETGITVTYQDSDGTIDFVVATQSDNNFTTTLLNKLNGIEASATADQTASEILTAIKTVDGGGSGLDADTVDGLHFSSFLRSDADDTASGIITLSSSSRDCLNFSASTSEDNRGLAFNGRIAISADYNDGYLRLNNASEFSNGVYTPLLMRADGGFYVDGVAVIEANGNIVASKVPTLNQNTTGSAATLTTARTIAGTSFNGSANIDISYNNLTNKPTIPTNNNQLTNGAGYITSASFSDVAGGGTFTGDIGISGGAGALIVNANSDIRFTNGDWTGDAVKIQHHSNRLYIGGGSDGIYFRESGTNRWIIDGSGHFIPASGNTYNIGSSSNRINELFVNDMHFSNKGSKNSVDGSWGDWTLQEGEEDIFMINNRSGKKFKIAMIPV